MRIELGLMCAALMLLSACGQPSAPAPAEAPQLDTSAAPAADSLVTPEIATRLKALPAPYNAADYTNGRRVFAQCRSCHQTAVGAPGSVGPNLHGVFGRKAGTAAGYAFSPVMKNAGWTWDEAQLDKWLENPAKDLPGTRMTFAGLRDPDARRDVIAYLKVETEK